MKTVVFVDELLLVNFAAAAALLLGGCFKSVGYDTDPAVAHPAGGTI